MQADLARNVFCFGVQCFVDETRRYHDVFCGKRLVNDDAFMTISKSTSGTFWGYSTDIRDNVNASHVSFELKHGAKHSPPARQGTPDCPSAQMRTSDFHIVSDHFGTRFESHMIHHGVKSNNSPMQQCPKQVSDSLRFIVVTREHV